MSIPHLLIVLSVVALVLGTRRLKKTDRDSLRSQLLRELGRTPVHSAETTTGKEVEFVRDRFPKRFPTVVALVLVVLLSFLAWWLAR